MRNTRYFTAILATLLMSITIIRVSVADTGSLQIADAWISEAPPTSKVMVAYMNINNTSDEDQILIKAESDTFSSIEMHETVHEDGLARMVRHDNILVPANSRIQLKRGGKHLMLFNPVKRLRAGDKVEISLNTGKGDPIKISIPVRKAEY